MTPAERKSLAEQITTNPLFNEILDGMERTATERLIFADEPDTARAQLRVQAIRTFRADLADCLSTRTRKGAPA